MMEIKAPSPFPPLWVANELVDCARPVCPPGKRLRTELTIVLEDDTAPPPRDCSIYMLVPVP